MMITPRPNSSTSKVRTSNRQTRLFVVVLTGFCSFIFCQAQQPGAPLPDDRESRWHQDLKFFAAEFANHQADFDKLYPQPGFNSDLARLQADIPKLDDAERTLRLIQLVARAGVAHTAVFPPMFKLG